MNLPFRKPRCPICQDTNLTKSRDFSAGHLLWTIFGEWMFWVLFAICVAFGLWAIPAGVVAGIISVIIVVAWDRTRQKYRCEKCKANWDYLQVTRHDLFPGA